MKKAVKWVLIVLIIAGAAAGGVYYMGLPLTVSAMQAVPKTAELYFTEQGIADVERTVNVYSPVQGRIESIAVTEKQTVSAGDTLCVLDTADLHFQIAQTESSIKSYQAQMDNLDIEERKARDSLITSKNSLLGELRALEAQENSSSLSVSDQIKKRDEQIRLQNIVIAQNEKDIERAKDDLSKGEILFAAGAISVNEYTLLAKALEVQESLLAQNRQQLQIIESGDIQGSEDYYAAAKQSLQAQIEGIDVTLTHSYTGAMKDYYNALIEGGRAIIAQLNQRIKDSTVVTPVSGVITTLYIKDSNVLNAQSPVALITPDMTNYVEVYVSTGDIDEISVGQEVDLILKRRSGDRTFTGVVKEIDDEAAVKLSVLGVEERRVKVTVEPVTGADEIKKGYDADVRFVVYREENKLTAPKTAFFIVNDKDMVWTIKDGKAVMTEVTKGRELRTEFIVESGLAAGDWVITDADTSGVKDGANVKAE